MPLFGRKKKEMPDKKSFREEIEQLKQSIETQKPIPEAPAEEPSSSAVQKLMQTIREGHKEKVEKKVEKQVEKPVEIPKVSKLPEFPSTFSLDHTFPEIQPEPEIAPEETEQSVQSAPLFVKIDRYRQILNAMNYLKSMLVMVKNNFMVLNELEKLRNENMRLVQDTIDKMDKKLKSLDSEFLRPSGFIEQMPELHDVQGLQATITDLRSQVDQLKVDLQHIT